MNYGLNASRTFIQLHGTRKSFLLSMTRTIRSESFRVDFLPSGDRIAHVVFIASHQRDGEPHWIELMRSIESSPEVVWPVSPPLQELHVESRDERDVALLVGRAGKSHWSASIGFERLPGEGDEVSEQLVFDIACRVSAHPEALGSEYQLVGDISWEERECSDELGTFDKFEFVAADGRFWRLSVDSPGKVQFDSSTRRVSIAPQFGEFSRPATIRWRFVLQRIA
jgi:hypothetical protein